MKTEQMRSSMRTSAVVRGLGRAVLLGLLALGALWPLAAEARLKRGEWYPISQEELDMTQPRIDPEASIEILLREYEVDDRGLRELTLSMYLRIKIFDQRGVDLLNPMEFVTLTRIRAKDVEARVIHPDGRIVVAGTDDLHSREIFRLEKLKRFGHSLALRGLEPGCIVEYKWSVTHFYAMAAAYRHLLADEYPIHVSRLRFRPLSALGMRWVGHMTGDQLMEEQKGGFWQLELRDVPAIGDHSFLPGPYAIQPWVYAYYHLSIKEPEKEWLAYAKKLAESHRESVNARPVRKKAQELTEGAANETEALQRIYQFCTHEIVNVSSGASRLTLKEIMDMAGSSGPGETLKRGSGSSWDVLVLFASLANAAGMKTAFAACNDRALADFEPSWPPAANLTDDLVAVKADGAWGLYNPAIRFLPFGRHHWSNENAHALVGSTEKELTFWKINLSPASYSRTERRGDFAIDKQGTLRGHVKMTYTGHEGIAIKHRFEGETRAEMEKSIARDVQAQHPGAQVSQIEVMHMYSPDGVPEIHYTVEVPAYADVTAQRIFLRCSYFECGSKPVFSREKRIYDIDFRYAREGSDVVRIDFPADFEVEEGSSPRSLASTEAFSHSVSLAKVKGRNRLVYSREVRSNAIVVGAQFYPAVKAYFDSIYNEDQHIVTLRRSGPDPDPVPDVVQAATSFESPSVPLL